MHYIVSVVGYASFDCLSDEDSCIIKNLATELGRALVDKGYIIINGGLGGVMEAVSCGGRKATHYTKSSIVGLIPNYDKNIANKYIDVALPLGFDVARNVSIASACDAMIVIGGRSGTLSEMALAWQLGKLIIALGDYGYGGAFKNKALDSRRNDKIYFAENVSDALMLLEQKLPYYKNVSKGINKTLSAIEAKELIQKYCKTTDNLSILGRGSEGFVFSDFKKVYKIFSSFSNLSKLYFHLQPLSQKLKYTPFLPHFDVHYQDNILIISYEYFNTEVFKPMPYCAYVELLSNFYYAGAVYCDMQPKNLLINDKQEFFMCDIGWDFALYSDELFESMCRRTFAIYKLQDYISEIENIKTFLSPLNTKDDFSKIEYFLGCGAIAEEYQHFNNEVKTFSLHKKLIKDFYASLPHIKSIFDYGAGSGAISYALKNLEKMVVGYEITNEVVKEYYFCCSLDKSIIGKKALKDYINANKKFDSVLCSLVLCHHLADNEQETLEIIDEIMSDIVALSNGHIFIVICNPLFLHADSKIQKRISTMPYSSPHIITKKMYSTKRERFDYHRPLSFYENLFRKFHLTIQDIFQSGDFKANHYKIYNSDFIFFSLMKE